MGWLDHKALQIVKGIGKTPGDPYSAENDPVVVNLMSGAITLSGDDGWTPNIPSTKNGGIWADSPLSDGRRLLAAAAQNVTENIVVIISDGSYLGAMKALDSLNKMAIDCRDFWQSDYQIDPVYLKWWAGCGAGFQYALISNIEVSPQYLDGINPTMRVSLAIEREPYWRGIPPGANPKVWTYEVNLSKPQFGYNVASLATGTDHLVNQTVANKAEWTPAAYGLQSTFISKNYVDISADLVPGDAPALVEMSMDVSPLNFANIYIGKTTKKYSGTGHDGIARVSSLILNAGDGSAAGVATKTNAGASSLGVLSNGSAATYYKGVRTVTGIDANWVTMSQWNGGAGANGIKLDRQFFRGTYAIFCRGQNSSATPVATDMSIRVFIEEYEENVNQLINSVTLPEVNPATNAVNALMYMGTVTLPLENRAVVSPLGYGIQLQESNSNIRISLQVKVAVATANRTFEFIDLIFMPLDEGFCQISSPFSTFFTSSIAILDNTGYFTRGEKSQLATAYATNANSGGVGQEMRGTDILLTPRTNQRIYIISDAWSGSGTYTASTPSQSMNLRLNIVPRWSGIRDV